MIGLQTSNSNQLLIIAVLMVLAFVGGVLTKLWLLNFRPDWTKPGQLHLGDMDRLRSSLAGLFPQSPAFSFVRIYHQSFKSGYYPETQFYIRSASKYLGKHTYKVELRFSPSEHHHIEDALPLLERVAGPISRKENSHGIVTLETSDLSSYEPLLEIAHEFVNNVLNADMRYPFGMAWHIAGYYRTKNLE